MIQIKLPVSTARKPPKAAKSKKSVAVDETPQEPIRPAGFYFVRYRDSETIGEYNADHHEWFVLGQAGTVAEWQLESVGEPCIKAQVDPVIVPVELPEFDDPVCKQMMSEWKKSILECTKIKQLNSRIASCETDIENWKSNPVFVLGPTAPPLKIAFLKSMKRIMEAANSAKLKESDGKEHPSELPTRQVVSPET